MRDKQLTLPSSFLQPLNSVMVRTSVTETSSRRISFLINAIEAQSKSLTLVPLTTSARPTIGCVRYAALPCTMPQKFQTKAQKATHPCVICGASVSFCTSCFMAFLLSVEVIMRFHRWSEQNRSRSIFQMSLRSQIWLKILSRSSLLRLIHA